MAVPTAGDLCFDDRFSDSERNKLLTVLGSIVTRWAGAETTIRFVHGVLSSEAPLQAMIESSKHPINRILTEMRSLKPPFKNKAGIDFLKEYVCQFDRMSKIRNEIIHGSTVTLHQTEAIKIFVSSPRGFSQSSTENNKIGSLSLDQLMIIDFEMERIASVGGIILSCYDERVFGPIVGEMARIDFDRIESWLSLSKIEQL